MVNQAVPTFNDPARMSVGVVTLGLIGGSLALALQARGVRVAAWDRNPDTRSAARSKGITIFDDLAELAAQDLDVIVVASPLFAMPEVMKTIAGSVPASTTITDAGSVKERVRQAVDEAGLSTQFIGAHPMAGAEKSGFSHANGQLFDGATWGVTVTKDSEFLRLAMVLQLITEVLQGHAIVTSDRVHDDSVAMVSHLPHVLAHSLTAVLAGSDTRELARQLTAGSFRDGTRVARGNADRNAAMIIENPRAVRDAVQEARKLLTELDGQLELLVDTDNSNKQSDSQKAQAKQAIVEFFHAGDPLKQEASSGLSNGCVQIETSSVEPLARACKEGHTVSHVQWETVGETLTVRLK